MRSYKQTSLILAAAVFVSFCASSPRPDELLTADKLLLDKIAAKQAQDASPAQYKKAKRLYKMAVEAYEDGDMAECAQYSLLASIRMSTALEYAKRQDADRRREAAQKRIKIALETQKKHSNRLAMANKRIARMEKILSLQEKLAQEKLTSKEAKQKAQLEAKARKESEERSAKVNQALATANSKVQTAEALDAGRLDPTNMNSAKTFLEQAQKAAEEGRYQNTIDLAKLCAEKADLAISKAKSDYSSKKQKMKTLEEHKALFAAASKLGAQVKRDQRGVVITLYEMFGPGRGDVLPERTYLLDKIAKLAMKFKNYPIMIEGYTDSRGRVATNLALSQSRAQAVASYMIQNRQLAFERIKSAGYGASNPIADNSKRRGRAKNRRIEVIFLFH